MAGLLDLFSGRSSDIYGEGLLTPEQRGGLGNIGLLALAGKLGQLAGPSFSPVPDFGAALGQAAGAYGASQEGAGTAALNAILTGQKGRKLEQELDYYKQLGPILGKLAGQWPGADGGAGGGEGSGSTGAGAAASPGAGGGGSANGTYWTPEGLAALRPTEGRYDQIHYPGGNPSTATGAYGFLDSTWREQAAKAGVDINQYPRAYLAPPAVQDRVAAITPIHHWTGVDAQGKPFNAAAQRLATNPNYVAGAAPTAAAPVGTGTSGLLAPTAPNPLSDAEPMVGIPRPAAPGAGAAAVAPNQVGRFAGIAPGTPVNSGGFPYNPEITDPAVAARVAQSMAAIKQAQQSGVPWAAPRVSGGGLLAPEDPGAGYGGGPPQGPAGDVGQAGPAGPATPRAPLPTMGPAGIELPPMQGPLAAPAPAAAAPAAPGPGLLSPPGAAPPSAPPIPRGANPAAYDAFLRNSALAGVLAKGAGLPDIFGSLNSALKDTLGYQGAVERQKQGIETEFAGPKAGAVAAAQDPYIRAQKENEVRLKTISDLYQKGLTIGADGQMQVNPEAIAALSAADAANLTGNQKEYKSYVNDQKMRNLPFLSEFDWSLAQKKAGAASTVLNTAEGLEAAQTKARIAIDTKLAETIGDQALTGKRLAPLLDEVIRLANQTPEGMAGPIAAGSARAFSALGLPVSEGMSNAELLNTITQRLVPIVREPGATSQGELSTYLQASPGLMQSAAGRIKIAEMTKALIARTDEIAKVYRNNLGAPDLHDKLAALDKPLFTDDQRAVMSEAIRSRTGGVAPPGAGAAPPGAKQVGTFQGKPVYEMPDGSRKVAQ